MSSAFVRVFDQHSGQGWFSSGMCPDPTDKEQYPWYMVDYITIEDRNLLHGTTKRMLEILVERVTNDEDTVNLNHMLLKRVWRAAIKCTGFTPSMKDDIVCIAGVDDRTAIELGLAPHASFWNKLWTIGPKPGVPTDVIMVSLHLPSCRLSGPI